MEYMFQMGFLGTKAPVFMDIIVIVMGLLPFLIIFSIWIVIREHYKIHYLFQIVSFILTLIATISFVYGTELIGGFEHYIKDIPINETLAFIFYIIYIIIASITMIIWYRTIKFAIADKTRRALPGLYTTSHKRAGKVSTSLIMLTSIMQIALYITLFIL